MSASAILTGMRGRENSGDTGSQATESVLSARVSAGPFRLSKTAFEVVAVFTFQGRQARAEQLALGDDDDVKARRDLVTPEYFSNQTLRAVPHDRASQPFRRGDAEPADRQRVRQQEQRGEAAMNTNAALVHLLEFDAAADVFV